MSDILGNMDKDNRSRVYGIKRRPEASTGPRSYVSTRREQIPTGSVGAGKAIKPKLRRFSWAKRSRRLVFGGLAISVAAVVLVVGSGLMSSTPQQKLITTQLQSSKKLFTAGEKPKFHLKLTNKTTALGSWLWPTAYAAEAPDVDVTYKDRKVEVGATAVPAGDGYDITLNTKEGFHPGSYTVTVSGHSAGESFSAVQNFAWGVLAINTDKATYLPGETAHIQMGVLSSQGHTLCDAPIVLHVTDPNGVVSAALPVTNSSGCVGDTFNSEPDYKADYTVGQTGTYKMMLTMADTDYEASDSFQVKESVPFDVIRSGATRVVPTSPYGMGLHVTAHQDFSGTVSEVLPDAAFQVLESPGATVTKTADQITLSWRVQWQAGQQYNLNYQYKVPPVSPAFYYVGPLTLTNDSGQAVYEETRAWQIAGDAAITFVKQTQIQAGANNSFMGNVTSTTGNTLIMFWISFTGATTHCLQTVVDSATNTWVVPTANPNQNPPQNVQLGVNDLNAMAYVSNATAITTVTVTQCGGFSAGMGFNVVEFSGIDNLNPVYDSKSGTYNGALTGSLTTDSMTLTLCDQPTTDMLMRGGNYFCADTSVLVIGMIYAGAGNYTLTAGGYTALTTVQPTGTTNQALPAYVILSTSGTTTLTETQSNTNSAYAWSLMAFRVSAAGSNEQSFFWSK